MQKNKTIKVLLIISLVVLFSGCYPENQILLDPIEINAPEGYITTKEYPSGKFTITPVYAEEEENSVPEDNKVEDIVAKGNKETQHKSVSQYNTVSWDIKDRHISARTEVECFVESMLKSPRSAKFPWFDYSYKLLGNQKYRITSYVDSQNSFGAMIRTHYNITIQYIGGDEYSSSSWKLVSGSVGNQSF